MHRFKFVALLLVIALVIPMVGATAQEPTEIRMWVAFTDARLDWAREKAAAFNEMYPQYNVVIEGYNNYEELFSASALSFEQGTQPAIVQYFEAATQDARDARLPDGTPWFKPVAQAIGDRTEINGQPVDFADIVPAVSNYYTLDGEWTSMPWNTSSAIMFANMDLLEAAGVMDLPTTWAEVEFDVRSRPGPGGWPGQLHHLAQPRLVLRAVGRPGGRAARQ